MAKVSCATRSQEFLLHYSVTKNEEKYPSTGLNIVLAPKTGPGYSAMDDLSSIWFILFLGEVSHSKVHSRLEIK